MQFLRFFRRRKRRQDPLTVLKGLCAANGMSLTRAIHVGAHHGEEVDAYTAFGFRDILWIEASPTDFAVLNKKLGAKSSATVRNTAICAFLSDTDGDSVELRRFNNDGASSSMYAGTELMKDQWPGLGETGIIENVQTATLDLIAEENGFARADFLAVDVQGAELLVLNGALKVLDSVHAVITEVSQKPFYDGAVLYPELKAFLEAHGFTEKTEAPIHGDQLYVRESLFPQTP